MRRQVINLGIVLGWLFLALAGLALLNHLLPVHCAGEALC